MKVKLIVTLGLVILITVGCLYIKNTFVSPRGSQTPNTTIKVNPPNPKKDDTKITHIVDIPKGITKPTKVKDEIYSSPDVKINDGEAEVIPKEDGGYTVVIEEAIRVEDKDYDWKIVLDGGVGIGYELIEVWKLNGDVFITTKDIGAGISFDIYNNTSVGVAKTIDYHGEVSTKLYLSVVF